MSLDTETIKLIILIAAGAGGTIGGVFIAIRKAMKPVEQQVAPPPSLPYPDVVTLHARVAAIDDKLDAMPAVVHACEARMIERITQVDKLATVLDSRLEKATAVLTEKLTAVAERVDRIEERRGGRR